MQLAHRSQSEQELLCKPTIIVRILMSCYFRYDFLRANVLFRRAIGKMTFNTPPGPINLLAAAANSIRGSESLCRAIVLAESEGFEFLSKYGGLHTIRSKLWLG